MRFKLTLSCNTRSESILPINYQYELSSWIYKTINYGNQVFGEWLHRQGYTSENKQFRLFCFSNFRIPKFKVESDRLKLLCDEVELLVSFYPLEAMEPFITGIFKEQEFTIGDRSSKASFAVKSVEKLKEPEFTGIMDFRLLSPVHVIRYSPFDREKIEHLSPEHRDFDKLLFDNLISKYNAYNEPKEFDMTDFRFELLSAPKEKVIQIKTGTPQATRLKSYLFDFRLQTDPELIRIGYYAGFGKANSQGFGCGEIWK